ncbi:HAD-IA family hydrolase [Sutcliffiella horikoshii]|uniref:HAD-IA family hydrolase n=1 Tax=Sutcliffiella horikoshii TaxID=79883 RepID=UPI00203B7923|nr:HAD-IA family hydrolase [Sutcliffiella horikoshii]MCM3617519.1 HAD-IA family hydrolase [Sutcliffiella horikoshii]
MQAIIFDMDGTLFQTDRILELALNDTFELLGEMNIWEKEKPTPIDTYRRIMGVPLPVVWETLLPSHALDVRVAANEIFHEKLIDNIMNGKGALYPKVQEALEYLKEQNIELYIASNGQTPYLQAIVEKYDLMQWISEVFSIDQIESLDKTELVGVIVKKYSIQHGAVVGDRLSDINAAKANGLTAIGCRFDFAQEEELEQADLVISSFEELNNIIVEKAVK